MSAVTSDPSSSPAPAAPAVGARTAASGLAQGRAPFSATFEFSDLTKEAGPLPVYEPDLDLDAEDPVEQIHVPRREQMAARARMWVRDFLQFWVNSLPHVTGAAPWILGLRSALAFVIPLLLGWLTGEHAMFFQVAVCAGALAMADPGGSFDRRTFTLLATGLFCASFFAVAQTVAFSQVATTLFIAVAVFLVSFTPEFANPGIRGGFLVASVALIGTAQHDVVTGMFSVQGFLYATPLVILLSTQLRRDSASYEAIYQNLEESWRLRVFFYHFLQHVLCRTAVSRHALRMAVSAFMAVNFSQLLGLDHPEWAAIASVILLHPTAPTFRARASALFTGTLLGCAVAAVFLMLIDSPVAAVALVCLSLVFATPFRHVDYAAYVTMYSVFFIGAVSLTSADVATDLGLTRIADTVVGVACSLVVLRFSMTEAEHHALMEEIEYASRPRGEYAPLADFAEVEEQAVPGSCTVASGGRCALAEYGVCGMAGSAVCSLEGERSERYFRA